MPKTIAKNKPAALALPHCTLSRVGLQFESQLTAEQWQEIGLHLEQFSGSSQWWLGDWLLHGEGKAEWGGMYDQVVDEFEEKYQTAAIAKHVAKEFDFLRRRKKLPWGHHREVAGLEVDQQDELLDWAEDSGEDGKPVTRKQLRDKVREIRKAARISATPELPAGVYRVIYADPPWEYGDKRTNDAQSGSAESQYPTMPIDEICGLPVRDMAAPDSVLFLWATAPLLTEAVQVIQAWGFTYKAQFVWDKLKGFNGHYNDVRHELLLVATRGSCVPAVDTLDPSVVAEKRTQHSRKPDRFYELIERLYPAGHRTHLELFARRARNGWQSWGNQVDAAAR
jgi:N6-adenosine-specific RNA methylase IME4